MAAVRATVHHFAIDEETWLPPDVQIADGKELVLFDHVQRSFALAGLATAGERPIPLHMERVSFVDAFVLAHSDASRQIDCNLDSSGAGHGLLHEHFGADILLAGTQLTANLSKTRFS